MMNNQTSPNYLRYLHLIIISATIIGLNYALILYLYIVKKWDLSIPLNNWLNLTNEFIISFITSGILWYIAGKIFNQYRGALIAFLVSLIGVIIDAIIRRLFITDQSSSFVYYYNITLLYAIVPIVVFAFFLTKNILKITISCALLLIIYKGSSIYLSSDNSITNLFTQALSFFDIPDKTINYIIGLSDTSSYGSTLIINYWTILTLIAITTVVTLIKFELFNFMVSPRKPSFNSTKLNLANNYSKTQISILFYSTRIVIDSIVFGMVGLHSHLRYVPSFTMIQYIIMIVSALITLGYVAYLHRKYLLEFMIANDKVPSWYYWFLIIPFANLIIFPIGLAFYNNKLDLPSRIERLKDASAGNNLLWIALIILLLQGLSLFAKFSGGFGIEGVLSLISVILVFSFMFGKYYNFYILTGWYLLLTLFILFSPRLSSIGNDSLSLITVPYGIVSVFILYGLFHIYRFSAVEEDQEQKIAKNQEE